MADSLAAIRRRIADESAGAQQVVRQVAAGVAPQMPPRSAPSSVFELGKPKRVTVGAPFDPMTVVVSDRKRGEYRPEKPAAGGYQALYDRMRPGQCAALPRTRANAFARWAKDKGISVIREPIGPGMVGVWRLKEGE